MVVYYCILLSPYVCVCMYVSLHISFSTQVIMVPSQRDVHHAPVYPQPPFVKGTKVDYNKITTRQSPALMPEQ